MGTRARRVNPKQTFRVGEKVKRGRHNSSYLAPKVHIEDIIEAQRRASYPLTDDEVMDWAQRMPQ